MFLLPSGCDPETRWYIVLISQPYGKQEDKFTSLTKKTYLYIMWCSSLQTDQVSVLKEQLVYGQRSYYSQLRHAVIFWGRCMKLTPQAQLEICLYLVQSEKVHLTLTILSTIQVFHHETQHKTIELILLMWNVILSFFFTEVQFTVWYYTVWYIWFTYFLSATRHQPFS